MRDDNLAGKAYLFHLLHDAIPVNGWLPLCPHTLPIRECRQESRRKVPLPGVSAMLMSMSLSSF